MRERERKRKHERQDDELYMEGRKRQNDQRTITKLVSGNIVSSVDANNHHILILMFQLDFFSISFSLRICRVKIVDFKLVCISRIIILLCLNIEILQDKYVEERV